MGIFLVAGFFVASLIAAIVLGIMTMRQYGPAALNNIMNYNIANTYHDVKIRRRAQPEVTVRPRLPTSPKLAIIYSNQLDAQPSDARSLNALADLKVAA